MLCMDKAEDSLALGLLANSSELIFVEFFFAFGHTVYSFFFPPSSVIIIIYLFILTPTTIFHFLLLQSFKAM